MTCPALTDRLTSVVTSPGHVPAGLKAAGGRPEWTRRANEVTGGNGVHRESPSLADLQTGHRAARRRPCATEEGDDASAAAAATADGRRTDKAHLGLISPTFRQLCENGSNTC